MFLVNQNYMSFVIKINYQDYSIMFLALKKESNQ